MSGNNCLIDIEGLEKVYLTHAGDEIHALADINLVVNEGEFVAIVGPSGCGKTTLLKILAGLILRSSGEVTVSGRDVSGPRSDIGMVFQEAVLLPWRSVLRNVLVPVEAQGLPRHRYQDQALELLDLVGLAGFEDKYPMELSGGMQQRVAICRALIRDPTLLLMDEPFGALDAMTREFMNQELQRIWLESGKTVLFITHSISEAVFLGDRVVVMSPRPGTFVVDIDIEIERPRALEVMGSERFGAYTNQIRSYFMSKGSVE